ncbi:O-antigen ligase family protein [Sphingomonas jaspsi]|uniref:O-antigen ligase family protein n=1 Tax=Sphingomonas jaspsi TaxID=392409 RepID=UPI0004AE43ED|nr:O-antigen ligase family protein [Sphingomonas jaspsi]
MTLKMRPWLAPSYLLLCLLLGGSSQAILGNVVIQLAGLAIIAVATFTKTARPDPAWRGFRWLLISLGLVVLLQLVPLPAALWQALPGRSLVRSGDLLLGIGNVWRPLSLSPFDTLSTLPAFIPPVAMLTAILVLHSRSGERMATVLAVAAMTAMVLGALQLGSHDGRFYLYAITNVGVLTGFFANGNHMAALLLCVIPFAAALVERGGTDESARQRKITIIVVAVGLCAVAVAGLALNHSLFGYAMVLPVCVASLLIAWRHRIGRPGRLAIAGSCIVAAILLVSVLGLRASPEPTGGLEASVTTRAEMAAKSSRLLVDHFPAGTGIGTFQRVYPTVEDPAEVNQVYVNHAHDDFLEWVVEGGLPGLALLAAALLWWGQKALTMLRDRRADGFAQAGLIAAVVLMIHSVIDFPLRTAALACLFAASTGLMITSRRLPKQRPELRPSRHLRID